jgi:hypothetical protein
MPGLELVAQRSRIVVHHQLQAAFRIKVIEQLADDPVAVPRIYNLIFSGRFARARPPVRPRVALRKPARVSWFATKNTEYSFLANVFAASPSQPKLFGLRGKPRLIGLLTVAT